MFKIILSSTKKKPLLFFQDTQSQFVKVSLKQTYCGLISWMYSTSFIWNKIWIYFYNFFKLNLKALKGYVPGLGLGEKQLRVSYSRYFYNGLGYKVFRKTDKLFIWIGLTHYTVIPIPSNIDVFAKKRRIYFLTTGAKEKLNNFLLNLRRIKRIDIYKGKGLSEMKTYKGFIKMKSTKKKQR